LIHYI